MPLVSAAPMLPVAVAPDLVEAVPSLASVAGAEAGTAANAAAVVAVAADAAPSMAFTPGLFFRDLQSAFLWPHLPQ